MKGNSFGKNPEEDKRKFERKELVTNVTCREISIPESKGKTQDISGGGLCLVLDKAFPPGSVLELRFSLPDKKLTSVQANVEVIWQKKTGDGFLTGVKFKA